MKKIKKAIIPAAGLGTRFLPATISCPKEMLTVVDKPVIQYIVEEAAASGIEEILIITRPGKETINHHFLPSSDLIAALKSKGKDDELKMVQSIANLAKIHYVFQEEQKGLADAIYCGKEFVGDQPFAVLLGDTIIAEKDHKPALKNVILVYEQTGKAAVLVDDLKDKSLVSRYGVVDPVGDIQNTKDGVPYLLLKDLIEKPSAAEAPSTYVIACRYVFNPNIFEQIKVTKPGFGGELQITDSMRFLAKKNDLVAVISAGQKYDIGNKLEFVKANIDFALDRAEMGSDIYDFMKQKVK